jgi:ribonuclease HIII
VSTEKFDLKLEPKLRKVLDAFGYGLKTPPPPYARLEAVGEGIRVTLYESGKLLLQGKRADEVRAELAAFELFGPASAAGGPGPLIGTDEAGKGDYFGPLVVAACFVDETTYAKLREIGVRDSKTIGDAPVRRIAAEVRRLCPHTVVAIGPAKYNELYETKFGNVNKMLAWAHARAIEDLLERCPTCPRVLTDQFAADPKVVQSALMERGRKIKYEQRPRAEEETAVAAASIIARTEFLDRLARLGEPFGTTLPKGAGAPVDAAAREFIAKHGKDRLREVAKVHFATTQKVSLP